MPLKRSWASQDRKPITLTPSSIQMIAPTFAPRRRNWKSRSASSSNSCLTKGICSALPPVSFFPTTRRATKDSSSSGISWPSAIPALRPTSPRRARTSSASATLESAALKYLRKWQGDHVSVYRVNKTRDFTVMGNTHLRDKNLSLKAVGLLSKMLSFNDGWQFSTRGLAALCKEGPDAILSALKELEENGYLVRHRGRDDKGRMVSTEFDIYEMPQAGLPHRYNPHRENPDVENPDVENPHRENPAQRNTIQVITQERNTLSKNYQSINLDGMDRMDERSEYEEIIKENLDYNILCQDPKFDKDRFREIMDIMLDAVCSTAPTIRINGEDMPQQVVKSRFLKLNSSHIEYVLEAMNKNPSDIRNIRAYLLTALYNASLTIDNYYSALVNHDFYGQDRSAGSKKPKTYDYSLCEDTL